MALPKRRHSSTRQAKRRTHDALQPPALGFSPETGEFKMSHRATKLGNYKGRQILTKKVRRELEKGNAS
ncbi:MAG: 50S ribosomal protein L32 [Candidatus Omnitrophica bacterium]|nr:50S ribosomal protein L32 [Candidatus Omnitrophota bacterium]